MFHGRGLSLLGDDSIITIHNFFLNLCSKQDQRRWPKKSSNLVGGKTAYRGICSILMDAQVQVKRILLTKSLKKSNQKGKYVEDVVPQIKEPFSSEVQQYIHCTINSKQIKKVLSERLSGRRSSTYSLTRLA